MSIGLPGSHSRGPILGDSAAMGGLFEDLPLAQVDSVRSPYKVWAEQFNSAIADATAFAELGATATAVGAVAANAISVTGGLPRVLLNPGTAVDTGWEVQFNTPSSQANYVNNRFNIIPANTVVSTTFAAGKELLWYSRVGLQSNAATWDGKALMGWFFNDTSLLSPTTGLPTVDAGGGVGFHIGEDGVISVVCDDAAITDTGTAIGTVGTLVANTPSWREFGFRLKVIDFTARTGNVDFFYGTNGNLSKVLSTRQTGTLPMATGATYSISYAILNGPVQLSDLLVESILTAQTRSSTAL